MNLRRLFNIQALSPPNTSAIVGTLDTGKAFDTVAWSFLFEVLKRLGFGPTFTSWIRLLYTVPTAVVTTNNITSASLSLHGVTRQGCPLSPLLFSLCIEPLAVLLRDSLQVTEYRLGERSPLYPSTRMIF